jgi:flagellar biosynthetic protein FliR
MTGLQVAWAENSLAAFILAVARTAGFVMISPPFNTKAVPGLVKTGAAMLLALPLTAVLAPRAPALASMDLPLQTAAQVLMGLTLGFFVLSAVSAISMAGDILDAVGGFQMSQAMDPLMLNQTSVMGRMHQMVAVTLLMATNGHLMILQGLFRSAQLMPTPSLHFNDVAAAVTSQVGAMALAAVQIAGPVMAAMIITDIALGLLARAAPALNAFSLGFPLKILFTLLLAGLIILRIPDALQHLISGATLLGMRLYGPG